MEGGVRISKPQTRKGVKILAYDNTNTQRVNPFFIYKIQTLWSPRYTYLYY